MFGRKKMIKSNRIVANASRIAGPRLLRLSLDREALEQMALGKDVLAYKPTNQVIRSVRDNQEIGTHNKVIGYGHIVSISKNEVTILMANPLVRNPRSIHASGVRIRGGRVIQGTNIENRKPNVKDYNFINSRSLSLGKIVIQQIAKPDVTKASFSDMLLE